MTVVRWHLAGVGPETIMKRILFPALLGLACLTPTHATAGRCITVNLDTGGIHIAPCKKTKITYVGGACSPCVNGCKDDVCQDHPFEPGELPRAAQEAEVAGDTCTLTSDDTGESGACSNGYAWACIDTTCTDSTGLSWWALTPGALTDAVSFTGSAKVSGDEACVELESDAIAATICGSDIAWCVGLDCGHSETRWGCQYFGDWGADDLATCVLTVTNEACGGCLEGGDEGEE